VASGDKDYKLGFLAGAGYEVPVSGAISLLVQALYTTGGTHLDLNDASDMTYAGNALAFPVMLRINPGHGSSPFLTAGGYAGGMFSPRLEIDTNGSSSEIPINGADVRPFLYGLAAGAGFEFELGAAGMFVEAIYSYGLSNLAKTGTAEVRPSALNLLVGFRF
jgi:opacity protein-like surface antigen